MKLLLVFMSSQMTYWIIVVYGQQQVVFEDEIKTHRESKEESSRCGEVVKDDTIASTCGSSLEESIAIPRKSVLVANYNLRA